jgi:hypothetical protein
MSQDDIMGTDMEIMGAAALFGVRVIVHSFRRADQPFVCFGRRGAPFIYLCNRTGLYHYDWYEPQF